MTDPDPTDDTWGELARELDELAPAKPEARTARPDPADDEAPADAEAADAEGDDDGPEGEAADGEGAAGDGPPGPGRKRRRRRRRRRKGGAAPGTEGAEGAEGAEDADGAEDAGDEAEAPVPAPAPAPRPVRPPARAAAPPRPAPVDDEDTGEVMDVEQEPVTLAADEDTGGDLLRDLIATWDVPAWDVIVAGLHRPGR